MDTQLRIADDLLVSLDYTLRLDDDEIIDSSEGMEPLEFIQGQGEIVTGLEQALYGLGVGDERAVTVQPADAYGEWDEDEVETVSRDIFPADLALEVGMGVGMRDGSGQKLTAYVNEIHPEEVVLDLNHPLAGETLHFQVKVVGVRGLSAEELAERDSCCCSSSGEGCCCKG